MTTVHVRPAVTVSQLLGAEDLGLRLVAAPKDLDRVAVEWISATELIDPVCFLERNELMLITGEQLDPDNSDAMRECVWRLADRWIRAIGFGVGLRHARVPRDLVTYCSDMGVALLEVPRGVPFGAISKYVADEIASQEYAAVRHTLGVHERLVKALTDGSGLSAMVEGLLEITGSECCIVDFYGTVLAESTTDAALPIDAALGQRNAAELGGSAMSAPTRSCCAANRSQH